MSERLYSDIIPLLSNGDPKIRRYALEQLIRELDRLDRKNLTQIFCNAADDEDEEVSTTAKYGLSVLFQREHAEERGAESVSVVPGRVAGRPGARQLREVRQAAEDVLEASLGKLREMALDRTDVEMGRYAVQVLGNFAFADSLETLYEAASMEDRRGYAIRAIANFEDEEVLFLLERFAERFEAPGTRATVLGALSNLPYPRVRELLDENLSHPSSTVRQAVARALGKFNDDEAERSLIGLLGDDSEDVVSRAVDSLSILGRAASGRHLAALTDSGRSARIRSRATTALGFVRDLDSLPLLYKLLDDTDHRVAANAVEALSRFDLQRDDVVRHIVPLLNHPNNRLRANAILLLSRVEEGRAMAALQKMLRSTMRLDRASAAWCAGEIASVDAVRWLVTLINTELESSVLSAALNALSKLSRKEARPALPRLFKHPNATIRVRAVKVFAALADGSAMTQLESLLSGERVQTVRSAIVSAMGSLCDSSNFMVVTRLLQDRNERVVANAIEALDRMGSLETTPFIQPFLKHQVNRIRANTIVALWKLGDLKVAADIHEMLDSKSTDSRRSAIHVLKQVSNFLQPTLLAERPLLLSALESRYRMRTRSKSGSVTEVSEQVKEIFRREKGSAAGEREKALSAFFRAREDGGAEAVDEVLSQYDGSPELKAYSPCLRGLPETSHPGMRERLEELRRLWVQRGFMPGLLELLEASKKTRDLKSVLAGYIALFRVQADLYSRLLDVLEARLGGGDVSAAQQGIKFLVERMPLQSNIHRELGDLAIAAGEFKLAEEQFERAFAGDRTDYQSALKLAACAVRNGEFELARVLTSLVVCAKGADEVIKERASRLRAVIERQDGT